MDVREKLVELLWEYDQMRMMRMSIEECVDRLVPKGVTVQEMDGCEYCKEDGEGFRKFNGAFWLARPFHGGEWFIRAGNCKPRQIYFCPMCGRKLKQPPKGE